MDQSNIDKVAKSCKEIALAVGTHPYHVASSFSNGFSSYPDSEWLAYRIKLAIHKSTDETTVKWQLPEPQKPLKFD